MRAAVAFLERAFGFRERVRIGEDHRAQMQVGADGAIVVADVRGAQVAPSRDVVTQVIKVLQEPETHITASGPASSPTRPGTAGS